MSAGPVGARSRSWRGAFAQDTVKRAKASGQIDIRMNPPPFIPTGRREKEKVLTKMDKN
jgi:hypothetical protein